MIVRTRRRPHGTTDAQRRLLAAIRERWASRGYAPSYRELADDLGVGINDVRQKLVRLRRDGLVEFEDGVCRTVRVVEVRE